jgi:hypothetical protein
VLLLLTTREIRLWKARNKTKKSENRKIRKYQVRIRCFIIFAQPERERVPLAGDYVCVEVALLGAAEYNGERTYNADESTAPLHRT